MPNVEIEIGGRSFEVACKEGEEAYLQAAARALDAEASSLVSQIGRLPEARMLLMAGLMLADRTASMEERLAAAEAKLAETEAELAEMAAAPPPPPERVEIPVIPQSVSDSLAELAARSEALAARVDDKLGETGA
ncbi:cell division protein ZapA [Rhodovulum adriaticum]|uniref:Cell division protein ZapA n=1 Tax=Rhodovulum adriaticum TaxID=35804 RepID=A0A4R2NP71_RHOAD|nr:cell division protein ZapA [Rhodovulum adriaticum]MBK1634526.1 cell division protein ZapA [Rhodovulum adriaticum]TCP23104.1 cell division protein ZapA [Rhodovulum adriaticum]